ncbi:MAG: riboflavin synthase [Candidatus Marinimicrobia bacterium]|nr:riboflavin synthase [Candidatus Neomarinimicrobiota bacterium]
MFTGIIETQGNIAGIDIMRDTFRIRVKAPEIASELHIDDSVAVNGICLTVTALQGDIFSVDAIRETAERSTLKTWKSGKTVNLERGMPADGRFDGHLVQGHVDGTAELVQKERQRNTALFTFQTAERLMPLIVKKGSIALDGVSLTVTAADKDRFTVALIPYTLENSTLGKLPAGNSVNVETDIIGKYIVKHLTASTELSEDLLHKWGYSW